MVVVVVVSTEVVVLGLAVVVARRRRRTTADRGSSTDSDARRRRASSRNGRRNRAEGWGRARCRAVAIAHQDGRAGRSRASGGDGHHCGGAGSPSRGRYEPGDAGRLEARRQGRSSGLEGTQDDPGVSPRINGGRIRVALRDFGSAPGSRPTNK